MKPALPFFLFLLLFAGCNDSPVSADSIPAEARQIADAHYVPEAYLLAEYQTARTWIGGMNFNGVYSEWILLEWITRQSYLPPLFTTRLPNPGTDEFYQAILINPGQFGFGWDDQTGDNPATYEWDGTSSWYDQYVSSVHVSQ